MSGLVRPLAFVDGRSPEPSAPSTGRRRAMSTTSFDSVSPTTVPRPWCASPTTAAQSHVKEILLVMETDEVTSPTSPLDVTECEGGFAEVRTHRTGGHKPVTVDQVLRVPSGCATSDVLDVVAYDTATKAAEGYHVCVMSASPTSLQDSVRIMLDGDDGMPQFVSLTLGYILDMFQCDAVSIDISVVCISAQTGQVTDLMRRRDQNGKQQHMTNLTFRTKWGLTGSLCNRVINDVEELVGLPTASAVLEAADDDPTCVVVLQCRIRRLQTLRTPTVTGDFDVVQNVSFLCLPATPWRGEGRFACTEAASPADGAEAFVNAYLAGTELHNMEDDSLQFTAHQVLRRLFRETISGPFVTSVIIPAQGHEISNFIHVSTAIREFAKLRTVTSRIVHPANAVEAAAISNAETQRKEAESVIAAVVQQLTEPAFLVHRDSWAIVGRSAAAQDHVPTAAILELCRLGSGGVLTAAEALELSERAMRIQPSSPTLHVRGAATMIKRCTEISDKYLLVVLDRPSSNRSTPLDPAAPPSNVTSTAPATPDKVEPVVSVEERRRAAAERREKAKTKPAESSCGCLVA